MASVGSPGFRIVEGTPSVKWYAVQNSATVYIGQIVQHCTCGVAVLDAANDAPQAAANGVPFGIVIGINNRTPTSNSTYSADYGTQVSTLATAAARDWYGVEGMWGKSDNQLFAKVALIDSTSIIEGPIFDTTYGTAPTVVTCTTADSNGLSGMIHSAGGAANYAAYNAMYYCRSGNNKGIYRQPSAVATMTTPTFVQPWPNIWTVGDTFVVTGIGLGKQKLQTDAYSMFIDDNANNYGGSYFPVFVVSMDLATAGQETAQFRFDFSLFA